MWGVDATKREGATGKLRFGKQLTEGDQFASSSVFLQTRTRSGTLLIIRTLSSAFQSGRALGSTGYEELSVMRKTRCKRIWRGNFGKTISMCWQDNPVCTLRRQHTVQTSLCSLFGILKEYLKCLRSWPKSFWANIIERKSRCCWNVSCFPSWPLTYGYSSALTARHDTNQQTLNRN